MSRALLDRWQVHDFAPGLYAERRDLKDGRLDRFIGRLLGRWAQRGSPLRRRAICGGLPRASRRSPMACWPRRRTGCAAGRRRRAHCLLAVEGLAEAPVAECFALVREVCSRQLGLRHYPVQLMGGYAMLPARWPKCRPARARR
jgi:preprotein translocase subunit SecA